MVFGSPSYKKSESVGKRMHVQVAQGSDSVYYTNRSSPLSWKADDDVGHPHKQWFPAFHIATLFVNFMNFLRLLMLTVLQAKLVHGEQFLGIKASIPTSGELVTARVRSKLSSLKFFIQLRFHFCLLESFCYQ